MQRHETAVRPEKAHEMSAQQHVRPLQPQHERKNEPQVAVTPVPIVIETPDPVAPVPELPITGSETPAPTVPTTPLVDETPQQQTTAEQGARRESGKKVRAEEFDVYFAAGSASVSGAPLGEVARLVAYLRRNPSAKVSLAGYVSGGEHRALAHRRVEAVRALLVGRYGIDARRVRTGGLRNRLFLCPAIQKSGGGGARRRVSILSRRDFIRLRVGGTKKKWLPLQSKWRSVYSRLPISQSEIQYINN